MLLIGTRNTLPQTVLTNGIINLGTVYRRFCKKNSCGNPAFAASGTQITIQTTGIYHVTATLVGSGTAAGNATVQLTANGVAIPGALATETITTAGTETRTFVIDHYVLVDRACTLGINATTPVTLALVNAGVGATIAAVTLNIEKVV